MITKNEIIEYIYNIQIVEKCANRFINVLNEYKDDFVQYIYLQLLEIEEDRLKLLFRENELIYYIIAICRNHALGKYSAFKKEHIRENQIEINEIIQSIYE